MEVLGSQSQDGPVELAAFSPDPAINPAPLDFDALDGGAFPEIDEADLDATLDRLADSR